VQCQNKGIRFVYCKFCDVPVAKINFSTRHKHGKVKAFRDTTGESSRGIKRTASKALQKAEAIGDTASVEISSEASVQDTKTILASGIDSAHEEDRLQTMPKSESQSQLELKAKSNGIAPEDFATVFSKDKAKISGSEETCCGGSSGGGDDTPRKKKKKRSRLQRRWLSLLDERPPTNDHARMKCWLKLVAVFSDPEGPPPSSFPFRSTTSGEDENSSVLSRLVEQGLAATELATKHQGSSVQSFKSNMEESKEDGDGD
jgi:hypothetical protein